MTNRLEQLNGTVLLLFAVAATSINVPLMMFLLRNTAAREDIVSMVMLSVVASDLCTATGFFCLSVVNFMQPVVVPYPLIFLLGNLMNLSINITIWHLAVMSAMKCYIIVRPLIYSTVFTERFRNLALAALWTVGIVVLLGANLGGVTWAIDPILHVVGAVGPVKDRLRNIDTAAFGASALVVIVSNLKIIFVVRQHHLSIGTTNAVVGEDQRGSVQVWLASVRSARSLLVMTVIYFGTYMPTTLRNRGDFVLPLWGSIGTVWLLAFAPVGNGLVYIVLYKTTRRDLVKMLFGGWVSQTETVVNTISTPAGN